MKKFTFRFLRVALMVVTLGITLPVLAQTSYKLNTATISITGTSTLHDWEMKSAQGTGDAVFTIDASGKITGITKLNFAVPANSIKSEHTMMDNNTYKALNTEKYANISFVLSTATVIATGNNNYQINAKGRLSIAGTTKDADLVATGKYNPADNSITITGAEPMKMTDYNVKPPTVMMGTIKTGNEINIGFSVHFVK